MSSRIAAISSLEAEQAAARAATGLGALPAFEVCERVGLYASRPDELPSRPLYERARAAGKALLWPRIDGESLVFACCDTWEALVPGPFGILVPPPDAPVEALRPGDLLLVPGRAFDSTGARLGRGGGHFDQVLAKGGFSAAVGVGFRFQLVEHVPTEPHDQPVSAVLFEDQLVTSSSLEETR